MLHTLKSRRGMVAAPHHLAAQAGIAILREGGNAVEAMVAAAATVAVAYPHMNSIGGDGFWLIGEPGKAPIGIDACGASAARATAKLYSSFPEIPARGPLAALTVAGTVSGWEKALSIAARWGTPLPLSRLLADAIAYAKEGTALPDSFFDMVAEKRFELEDVPGFKDVFLKGGPILKNEALSATLSQLAAAGLGDFYRGDVARAMARDLEEAGSPLRLADLEAHEAQSVAPLSLRLRCGEIFNLPPPTQGLASLLILGIYDRVAAAEPDGFDHIHRLVECTKAAFRIRDRVCVDPFHSPGPAAGFLTKSAIGELASSIDFARARPYPDLSSNLGDTVWMGAIDGAGRAVSFIQSTYWEFGSGLVLPATGVNWQNRGASFSLDPSQPNALHPGKKPFHTLNPAFARLKDGRVMVYGTMGGDGQPQTQAAVFSRYAMYGAGLQAAVTAPRWLLGRTWGSPSTTLKVEARFPSSVIEALHRAGHRMEITPEFSSTVGHAGGLVRDRCGVISGACDPRADGAIAAL